MFIIEKKKASVSNVCGIKISMTDVQTPILPVWVRLGFESPSSENCSCNSVYCVQKRGILLFTMNVWMWCE